MTLSQLALTVLLLGVLGLGAHRLGVSAIPAYLLSGLLLGPHEPHVTSLITPSEVTDFLAELGLVFLLFFLGLEFSLGRLSRSGRIGRVHRLIAADVGLLVEIVRIFAQLPLELLLGGVLLHRRRHVGILFACHRDCSPLIVIARS